MALAGLIAAIEAEFGAAVDLAVNNAGGLVARIPAGREGKPQDVADAVLYLASPLAAYVTGETMEINGGLMMR